MTSRTGSAGLVGLGLLAVLALAPASQTPPWTDHFPVEPGELGPTGRNPYFVLEPGYWLELEGGGERLIVTVLGETRVVGGIEARIVEERETRGGTLVEVSRNYYAISRRSNSVFYLGEDVDTYSRGRLSGHGGSWVAGSGGARFGLMMPGQPLLGGGYYEELAPGIALDRARIVGLKDSLRTRAGVFHGVLRIEETTPLEPGSKESKRYAPGVGLIQDGSLTLVRYGTGGRPSPEAEVEEALARYERWSVAMAHDSIASLFTPDGAMSNAGQAPIIGPAAIRTFLRSFAAFHVLSNRLIADTTRVQGDTARQTGSYRQRVRIPAGDTVEVSGRFVAEWVKLAAGDWRLRRLATAPPE